MGKSRINISKVKGNIVISQGQHGGATSNNDSQEKSKSSGSFFTNKYVLLIGLIASVLGILAYFGFQPKLADEIESNRNIENTRVIDSIKLIDDSIPTKTESKKKQKEMSKGKNDEKISVKNVEGDVVISQNQTGGITAHTVNINKPEKRSIKSSISDIVTALKTYPPAAYRLEYYSSDPEAVDLATDIDEILKKLNWQRIEPIKRMGGPQFPAGITLYMLKAENPMIALSNQLWTALGNKNVEGQILTDIDNVFRVHGWSPVDLPEGMNGVVIVIGPNPD